MPFRSNPLTLQGKFGGTLPSPLWKGKTLANLQPTGVGKQVVQGAKPPGRGFGGCAPRILKEGASSPPLVTLPRVGPKTLANPKPTGVGNWGWRGRSPLPGGMGDVPPQNHKRGRVAPISNPTTSGTQSVGKPSAYGGGQMGVQGAEPPGGGCGGVPPQNLKRGRVANPGNPATNGTQNVGEP
jgi:hypothetical protein